MMSLQSVTDPVEPCLLGDTVENIPNSFFQGSAMRDVFNYTTWKRHLSDKDRDHLRKFLPEFEGNKNLQEQAVQKLFSGENIKFGNPLTQFQHDLRKGHYHPEVWYYQRLRRKALHKAYKHKMLHHHTQLLENLVLVREKYISEAQLLTESEIVERLNGRWRKSCREYLKVEPSTVDLKARKLYKAVLDDMHMQCPDEWSSTDEDAMDLETPDDPLEKMDEGSLLLEHKKRRSNKEIAPTLDTRGITIQDIMDRVYKNKEFDDHEDPKQSQSVKKVKVKEKKKSKLKLEGVTPASESRQAPYENLFSLLKVIMTSSTSKEITETEIVVKLNDWLQTREAQHCPWVTYVQDWTHHIPDVLGYLSGEITDRCESEPIVVKVASGSWIWVNDGHDSMDRLQLDWQHLLESMPSLALGTAELDNCEPKQRTDYVVRPSTAEEKIDFQKQETERFFNPHRGFVYRVNGYEAVVGPVKGVYEKHSGVQGNSKAREHAILVNERPSYVTILTLVRDAAARLPNGEGTRADICELLKDSQYIAPGATDNHVNTVVSGALDRLHYEKDPCVKYDAGRKVWIYLHRSRTAHELEKIHEAQGAAMKAKKALKPPKPITTPTMPTNKFTDYGEEADANSSITDTQAVDTVHQLTTPVASLPSPSHAFIPLALHSGTQASLSVHHRPAAQKPHFSPISTPTSSEQAMMSPVSTTNVVATNTSASNISAAGLVTLTNHSLAQDSAMKSVVSGLQSSINQQARRVSLNVAQGGASSLPATKHIPATAALAEIKFEEKPFLAEELKLSGTKPSPDAALLQGYPRGTVFYQRIATPQGHQAVMQKVVSGSSPVGGTNIAGASAFVHRIVGGPGGSPVLARLIHTPQSQPVAPPGAKNPTHQFTAVNLRGSVMGIQGSAPGEKQVGVITGSAGPTPRAAVHILTGSVQAQATQLRNQLPARAALPVGTKTQVPAAVRVQGQPLRFATMQQQQLTSGEIKSQSNIQLVKAIISSGEGKQGSQAYILTTSPSAHGTSLIASGRSAGAVLARVLQQQQSCDASAVASGGSSPEARSILVTSLPSSVKSGSTEGQSGTQGSLSGERSPFSSVTKPMTAAGKLVSTLEVGQLTSVPKTIEKSELSPSKEVDVEGDA